MVIYVFVAWVNYGKHPLKKLTLRCFIDMFVSSACWQTRAPVFEPWRWKGCVESWVITWRWYLGRWCRPCCANCWKSWPGTQPHLLFAWLLLRWGAYLQVRIWWTGDCGSNDDCNEEIDDISSEGVFFFSISFTVSFWLSGWFCSFSSWCDVLSLSLSLSLSLWVSLSLPPSLLPSLPPLLSLSPSFPLPSPFVTAYSLYCCLFLFVLVCLSVSVSPSLCLIPLSRILFFCVSLSLSHPSSPCLHSSPSFPPSLFLSYLQFQSVQGMIRMLDNTLCHMLLKPLLPSLSLCLHDKAEVVRIAMVDLLLKVKGIRSFKVR